MIAWHVAPQLVSDGLGTSSDTRGQSRDLSDPPGRLDLWLRTTLAPPAQDVRRP